MADSKISDLTAVTNVLATDEHVLARAGTTRKITSDNLAPIAWKTAFSEDGTSLANWTQDSGSWSVVSSALHVNTTGGTIARLKFNTAQGIALSTLWTFSADVMMETTGVGTDAPLGLLTWWDGSGSGNPTGQLFKSGAGAGTKQVRAEIDQTSNLLAAFTPSPTWSFDTYVNFRLTGHGEWASIALDNVLVGTFFYENAFTAGKSLTFNPFVGLIANNCNANFKNIKLSYLGYP